MKSKPVFNMSDAPQGGEEWFAERHGVLTASRAKRFTNARGDFTSGLSLMAEMVAESYCQSLDPITAAPSGLPCSCYWAEFGGSIHTDRGNDLEPYALDALRRALGCAGRLVTTGLCTHPGNGLLGFSPDGLLLDDDGDPVAGVEIKCPQSPKHLVTVYEGEVPEEYLHQIHFSLAVSGLPSWWFVSYDAGRRPFIKEVHADDRTFRMVEAIKTFAVRYSRFRAAVIPGWEVDPLDPYNLEQSDDSELIL